jgi:hypothetical protein
MSGLVLLEELQQRASALVRVAPTDSGTSETGDRAPVASPDVTGKQLQAARTFLAIPTITSGARVRTAS